MEEKYRYLLNSWVTNGHKMHTPKDSYYVEHALHDILIIYGLFNNAVRRPGYKELNGRMMNEQ
jgi:hypothetical protein